MSSFCSVQMCAGPGISNPCSQRGCEAAELFPSSPLDLWGRRFQLGAVSKLFISGLVCSLFVVCISQAIPLGQLAVPIIFKEILCTAQFSIISSAQGSLDSS